jgi:hypothetical protein
LKSSLKKALFQFNRHKIRAGGLKETLRAARWPKEHSDVQPSAPVAVHARKNGVQEAFALNRNTASEYSVPCFNTKRR